MTPCQQMATEGIAERIRRVRESMGLGVNELNQLVRLPNGTCPADGFVSRLESGTRGARISQVYAEALARALHVRTQWLLHGTGPQFESDVMPAVQSAARIDKPNLERVLARERTGRWSEQAVAAARAIQTDRTEAEWPTVLDRLQVAVRRALRDLT